MPHTLKHTLNHSGGKDDVILLLIIPNSASAKHPPCHALSFSSGLNILNTAFTTSFP